MRIENKLHSTALAFLADGYRWPAGKLPPLTPKVDLAIDIREDGVEYEARIIGKEIRQARHAFGLVKFCIRDDLDNNSGTKAEWELSYPPSDAPGASKVAVEISRWYETLKGVANVYLAGLSVHGGDSGVLPGADTDNSGDQQAGAENKS